MVDCPSEFDQQLVWKVGTDIAIDRRLWEQPSTMPWTHRSVRESRDIARYVDT